MSSFFAFSSELPAGSGFSWYCIGHLLWLALTILLCAAILLRGEKIPPQLPAVLCAGMLAIIAAEELWFALTGHFDAYALPLHLCGMAPFLCTAHCVFKKDWLSQAVYCLCLPGAAAALLFPGWNEYPMASFRSICGFTIHLLIVLYCVCALKRGSAVPRLKSIWKVWAFLLLILPPVRLFNGIFGTNYWFLNMPVSGTPLELLRNGNEAVYLFRFAGLALAVMLILLLPWEIVRRLKTKSSSLKGE